MALWRCQHCGTPQPVAARCWVCRRSSTSCGTCRHFRLSVAAGIGYCGLDRERKPLAGDEIRGCWTGKPAGADDGDGEAPTPEVDIRRDPAPAYTGGFIPVDALVVPLPAEPIREPAPPIVAAAPASPDGMLWAELDA